MDPLSLPINFHHFNPTLAHIKYRVDLFPSAFGTEVNEKKKENSESLLIFEKVQRIRIRRRMHYKI